DDVEYQRIQNEQHTANLSQQIDIGHPGYQAQQACDQHNGSIVTGSAVNNLVERPLSTQLPCNDSGDSPGDNKPYHRKNGSQRDAAQETAEQACCVQSKHILKA